MGTYTAKQISRTASIILDGCVDSVFPLFGAREEKKWARGWDPGFIYPEEGNFTRNQVFRTSSSNDVEKEFNWILSHLDLSGSLIVYTVFTENRVWTIRIKCRESGKDKTRADITYTYTGLNETGDALNRIALEEMYKHDLRDWEEEINLFLKKES
jgi:hypothetical protein